MARMGIHGSRAAPRVQHWSQGANRIQNIISVSVMLSPFFFRLAMFESLRYLFLKWILEPSEKKKHIFQTERVEVCVFFLQLDDGSMCLIETFESWPVDGLRPRWLSELQAAADMTKVAWSGTQQGPVIDSWLTQALKGKPTIDYRFYRCVIRNQEIQ